jgi:hypothetical protein
MIGTTNGITVSFHLKLSHKYCMRKWMKLIERAEIGVPDFKQFVTPQLIDELLTTGVWSPHGSGVDDWWDEGSGDYNDSYDAALTNLPLSTAMKCNEKAVRDILHRFLLARADWIHRNLTSGDHGIAPMTPESPLHRAIVVSDVWIEAMQHPRRGALPLGIYWGLGAVEAWGAQGMEAGPHIIEVTTKVKYVSIDWYQTFRSRLDWMTGDDEQEIQLFPGSAIEHVERIIYHCSDVRPDLARENAVIPVHPSATFIA